MKQFTMSMFSSKEDLYKAKSEYYESLINGVTKSELKFKPYRSGGFLNRDYDMGRITIDLSIIEAKKLYFKLSGGGA